MKKLFFSVICILFLSATPVLAGTIYHSDGTYSTRSGDTTYHSDGTYSTRSGNTIYHSDGTYSTIND